MINLKYKFITILCLCSSLLSQDGKLAVSILDFTGEDVSDKLLRACYQKLETSLIESNQYTVIAKNQRDEILEEQKIQNSGICDEDCAVEIGQLIGAEYLMLGNIIGFPDLYQVNIKIINIEKGDVVEKVTKEIQGNLSDLLNGMAESSREITRRIASGGGQFVPQQPGMEIVQKKYGSIIIESTPSGATVLIDNVKKGSTPLELKNIEVGTRKLKLIKTGYVTISKGVIINEENPVNVSEVFILKTGNLSITSEPTGAMVYINGAVKGKTPLKIPELTIGDYNVTVSSENYHDKTERVMVEYDRKNSKNFILQPKPGTVTIIIDPPEAKISVGYKQYKAEADGIASIELPVGRHKIDFRSKGYESVTKNVTVSANEKKSLDVQMYLSKSKEQSDETFGGSVYSRDNYGLDPLEAARLAKSAAEKAQAQADAATEAAIQAAATKAASQARSNAKQAKKDQRARKLAEEEALLDAAAKAAGDEAKRRIAEELGIYMPGSSSPDEKSAEVVDLPEVSALSGWNIGIAPSIGFVTGASFTNMPTGATVVITTPYGFRLGPLDFTISAAFGSYSGKYESAKGNTYDEFNPTVTGVGVNVTLASFVFAEGHVGTVGEGTGIRGFAGVSLEYLMKKGLNLPFNVLVGGEGFFSSDMREAGNPSGWMSIGLRVDYGF